MIVRRARTEEMAGIGRLRVAAYEAGGLLEASPSYTDTLRGLGADGSGEVLVAVGDGGGLVGTVMLCPADSSSEVARGPDEVEVRAFAVSPGAQGGGVGRLLMRALINRAGERGASRVVLSTQPRMSAAQALYRSLGFVRTPERDWSPLPGLTLLTFALSLDPARTAEADTRAGHERPGTGPEPGGDGRGRERICE